MAKENVVKMQEKKKPPTSELGAIGTSVFGTLVDSEYLREMTWPNSVKIYDRMRRSDAQVQALLLALELPIRSTRWYVEPYSNASRDRQIAEYIEENLMAGPPNGMTIHWDDFLRLALGMNWAGYAIFEKVFEVQDDGLVKWRKFAERPQRTIKAFFYDDTGGPAAIEQWTQGTAAVKIPIDRLLVFTKRKEGGHMEGMSVLRAAYKHWFIKDFLYKVINIGIERNLVGTPVGKLPEQYTEDDEELMHQIVTTLRSAEQAGVTLPPGFELDLFEGKRNLYEVKDYLEHHDTSILKAGLAQFLNLGTKDVGSWALSEDQSSFFLMALNADAQYIANTINSYAIPQLVDYNWDVEGYPTIKCDPVGNRGKDKIINGLKTLIDGKVVLPDDNLEEFMRDLMGLPEPGEPRMAAPAPQPQDPENPEQDPPAEPVAATEPRTRKKRKRLALREPEQKKPEPQQRTGDKHPQVHVHNLAHDHGAQGCGCGAHDRAARAFNEDGTRKWRRDLTTYERRIRLDEIERRMDTAEDLIQAKGLEIINDALREYLDKLVPYVQEGKLAQIAKADVNLEALETWLANYLVDLSMFGAREAAQEHEKEPPEKPPREFKQKADTRAALVTQQVAARISTRAGHVLTTAIENGVDPTAAIAQARRSAEKVAETEMKGHASAQVAGAINTGRNHLGTRMGARYAQRSEILDERTCPLCRAIDGMVARTDSREFKKYRGLVHNNCRGIWAFILPEEEPEPQETWQDPPKDLEEEFGNLLPEV